MLFELLPHFARLMPVADKYLASRTASDKAQEAAMSAMAGNIRGQLGQVAEAHEGIYRQMREQSTQMTEMAVQVTRARMGVESVELRIAKLEKTAATAMKLLGVAVVLLAMVFAMLVVRMVR